MWNKIKIYRNNVKFLNEKNKSIYTYKLTY